MLRRALLLVLLAWAVQAQPIVQPPPAPATPAERQRQLDGFWARQRQREAEEQFWNGPREKREALTQDQLERWRQQRDRRQGIWEYGR